MHRVTTQGVSGELKMKPMSGVNLRVNGEGMLSTGFMVIWLQKKHGPSDVVLVNNTLSYGILYKWFRKMTPRSSVLLLGGIKIPLVFDIFRISNGNKDGRKKVVPMSNGPPNKNNDNQVTELEDDYQGSYQFIVEGTRECLENVHKRIKKEGCIDLFRAKVTSLTVIELVVRDDILPIYVNMSGKNKDASNITNGFI
jgi:hypothetical protein